jgi:hypothetical protein
MSYTLTAQQKTGDSNCVILILTVAAIADETDPRPDPAMLVALRDTDGDNQLVGISTIGQMHSLPKDNPGVIETAEAGQTPYFRVTSAGCLCRSAHEAEGTVNAARNALTALIRDTRLLAGSTAGNTAVQTFIL